MSVVSKVIEDNPIVKTGSDRDERLLHRRGLSRRSTKHS